METMFAEAGAILAAFASDDAWEISEAMKGSGVWLIGLIVTLGGAALMLVIYKLVPFIDRHFDGR